MTSTLSLSTSRVRFAGITVACAGLLFWSCDENPVLPELLGESWVFQTDTISSTVDTTYRRTRSIGNSATLYGGFTAEPVPREAGIVLKFGNVDSTQLANLDSARLLIFRRTFEGSPEPPTGAFTLEKIISAGDTTWLESNTVMTLDDFPVTDSVSSSSLITDSVKVFVSAQSMAEIEADYLAFAVDQETLLDWREGTVPNNGFLLRAPEGSNLVSFYSSESTRRPYLVVNYRDTTETVTDISYYLVTQDISVYPYWADSQPPDGTLLLNRSDGHRVHINFNDSLKARAVRDSLEAREPRPIAGGRLVFNVDRNATLMQADAMDLQVWLRSRPIAEGDSGMINYAAFTYQAHSDSLVYNLAPLLVEYQKNPDGNYGFDLVITANNHDFDRLVLWGTAAPDPRQRPRLEIIYALPFGAGE